MTRDEIVAVVVSYHGAPVLRETVAALRPQVGEVCIVDNGSDAATQTVLAELEMLPGVVVRRLGANLGIGRALNEGLTRARATGRRWLLTMDQDSVVDSGMIAAFGRAVARDPSLSCLAPRREGGSAVIPSEGPVGYAITSGNLVRLDLFDRIGAYDEGFFIDCVDFDFSLRVRRAGATIQLVPDATMRHRLGEAVEVPPSVRRVYARHSPVRRYYMYRNYCYLAERYLFAFPKFVLKLGVLQLLLLPLIGLFDERPLRSYRAVLRGVWDYGVRRLGPYAGNA